jgi:hypothetical protein
MPSPSGRDEARSVTGLADAVEWDTAVERTKVLTLRGVMTASQEDTAELCPQEIDRLFTTAADGERVVASPGDNVLGVEGGDVQIPCLKPADATHTGFCRMRQDGVSAGGCTWDLFWMGHREASINGEGGFRTRNWHAGALGWAREGCAQQFCITELIGNYSGPSEFRDRVAFPTEPTD